VPAPLDIEGKSGYQPDDEAKSASDILACWVQFEWVLYHHVIVGVGVDPLEDL
jgi:hypothetical protein